MIRKSARLAALALSLFLPGVSTFAGAQELVVNDRFLDALAMIESGVDHTARGKAGERGAWQIKSDAWRYTTELRRRRNLEVYPFSSAASSTIGREYARTLLEDHRARFINVHGRPPTASELYAIWNLGFDGFRRRGSLARCPALTRDAAQRLDNLLQYMSPTQVAADERMAGLNAR
jgi:hypothetical protein